MRHARALFAGVALPLVATVAAAQGSPVRMELQGPGSRVSRGALRCAIGDETQFSLNGLDSTDQRVVLEQYLPEVTSSDERVLVATLDENSPYIVNATCKADGEAWILVQSGDAKLEFPALVGRARSRPAPRARGEAATAETPATPATQATPATPATPATRPGTTPPGAQVVAPANATRATGTQGPQVTGAPASETRASVVAKPAAPDAPAVAATGLVLYAGYNNVQLTWKPAAGAAGYRVARKDVAANELVTLTGDNVTADGRGLVRDTTFFDGNVVADRQYVYYLATYFQRPNGDFYFPDRDSEARGVATPRSTQGKPWLPADVKDRPRLKSVALIDGPALSVSWHIKDRAAGYIFFTYVNTQKNLGNSCPGHVTVMPALSSPLPGNRQVTRDSSLIKGVPGTADVDRDDPRARVTTTVPVTMYCLRIHAVYPETVDGSGTPVVVGYDAPGSGWGANAGDSIASKALWIAVRRTCESEYDESRCTPWKIIPSEDLLVGDR